MADDIAAPVKGLLNAFSKGILICQRVTKAAQRASETQRLDTLDQVQALDKSLAESESRVKDVYAQTSAAFGRRLAEAFDNNQSSTSRLQGLTINLLDLVMNLNEYMDDPNGFDLGSFRYLLRESERCCNQTIEILGKIHQQMLEAGFQRYQIQIKEQPQTNEVRHSPQNIRRKDVPARPISEISPTSYTRPPITFGSLSPHGPPPILDDRVWPAQTRPSPRLVPVPEDTMPQVSSPASYEPNLATGTSYGSFGAREVVLQEPKIKKKTEIDPEEEKLIKRDHIIRQVSANEEFLEKRRRSRMSFSQDLEQLMRASTYTTSTMSPAANTPAASPEISSLASFSSSPVRVIKSGGQLPVLPGLTSTPPPRPPPMLPLNCDVALNGQNQIPASSKSVQSMGLGLEGEIDMTRTVSSEGQSPQQPSLLESGMTLDRPDNLQRVISNQPSAVTTSINHPQSHDRMRVQRIDSEPMIFGPPESPPPSEGRHSGRSEDWGILARTLRLPGFGHGVEDGIETVERSMISDPGIMLASESEHSHDQPTPAISIISEDYAMRHDSSFYRYGGFCDGAKTILRGTQGALKVHKRPAGQYTATVSMKCISCAYEVGWNQYEQDCALDRAGIYGAGDMRFRLRFLTKSHVATKSANDPSYACIFCVEENKTLEIHDATVFFSVSQLFLHLQKHARPLKEVEGLTVIYGDQPHAVDFDLHVKNMESKACPFNDINAKLAARPAGIALVNHRDRVKGFRDHDPEGQKTLQFAVGAKIVGITYPPRFNGTWCCGYHDGLKALFPAYTVQLEQPNKDDVLMNPKSSLVCTAKYDHKIKDANTGWLSFGKKDKIIHVGYSYQEHWCWSGQNSKGKWGLFPSSFVENLTEAERHPTGGLNPKGSKEIGPGSLSSVNSLGVDGRASSWGKLTNVVGKPLNLRRRGTSGSHSSNEVDNNKRISVQSGDSMS